MRRQADFCARGWGRRRGALLHVHADPEQLSPWHRGMPNVTVQSERLLMRQLKNLMFGMGMAAVLATTGCASWHNDGDRTAGRVVDDNHVTGRVEDKLGAEPVYKFSDVDVKTFNGVVQLSGFVDTEEQKARAGEVARSVEGVANVVNNITLKSRDTLTPTGRTNELNRPYLDGTATRDARGTNTLNNPQR